MRSVHFTTALISLLTLASACSDPEPKQGSEGDPCYPNGTCDEGLACRSDFCVDLTGGSKPSGSSGSLVDFDACFECGKGACSDEAQACDEASGCGGALECWLACGTDVGCVQDCDTSKLDANGTTALQQYSVCVGQKCAADCAPDLSAGPATVPSTSPGSSTAGGSVSVDLMSCFSCGKQECSSEAQECDDANGCGDTLACWLTCGSDAACVQNCDVSALDADGVQALQAYSVCVGTQCASECTAGAGVTPSSSSATPNAPAPPPTATPAGECSSNESIGSCVNNNAETCIDGQWETQDCTGCGIVSPASVCGRLVAFVLDSSFDAVDNGVVSLEQTATSVTATFRFTEAAQTGYIQLDFDGARTVSRASVIADSSAGSPDVTLEYADSTAGCEYTMSSSGTLSQSSSQGCWPDEYYNPLGGDASYLLNVRLAASGTGTQTLTVSTIALQ